MSVLCWLQGSFFVLDSKSLMDQIPMTLLWSYTAQDVYFLFQHVASNILPPLILNLSDAKNLEFHPTHLAGLAFLHPHTCEEQLYWRNENCINMRLGSDQLKAIPLEKNQTNK